MNNDKYYNTSLNVSWISMGVNIFLVAVKLIIGIASNSIAVMTDAVHSVSDMASTGVVIASIYGSKKPADSIHPYGHGRAEDIGGLVLSFILLLVGLMFMKDSIMRLINPQEVQMNYIFISIVILTAPVKLGLGIFTNRVGENISSPILKTDALHHYSDFLTTVIVAIGLFFVRAGHYAVDSMLGIFVAVFIIAWSAKSSKNFIDNLLGKRAPLTLYNQIKKAALSFHLVEGVHGIEIHSYGKMRIISLHIEVSSDLSLEEAHSVADSIEKDIRHQGLGKCIVHVDLKHSRSTVGKKEIEQTMKQLVAFTSRVKGFRGITIVTTESGSILNFDLILDKNTSLEESHVLEHHLSQSLKDEFNFSQVNIHVEPEK